MLSSGVAAAQSTIAGAVRDHTGAVLPGVIVEASSPTLIEQTRTAVTDGQGLYAITELRPGTYTLKFTLSGFNTHVRNGIELPANFTAAIDVALAIGSLEESIIVTGASPIVDTRQAQRSQVLTREVLEVLPAARNAEGYAALIPGVRLSNTDVGGNQQMEQTYMRVHGSRQTDTVLQIDGLNMNTMGSDGQILPISNMGAQSEITYSTSAAGADVSGGGVRINMVPKEGGNSFSGSAFVGGSDGSWQSNNVTSDLVERQFRTGNRVAHIYDINLTLGGPIVKDKLWFLASWRKLSTDDIVANTFYAAGPATYGAAPPPDLSRPAVQEQWIKNETVRLTWQVTPRNKLNLFHERYPKYKGHAINSPLTDPETAAEQRDPQRAAFYMGQAKWTSPVTSRLLLETGFTTVVQAYKELYQPGIHEEPGTPEWYSKTRREDRILQTKWGAATAELTDWVPSRYGMSGSASYVTGSHGIKTGVQWHFGGLRQGYSANGDLYQVYANGVPDTVRVLNTPVVASNRVDGDVGIYAQDAWTIDRLTVNAGLRLDILKGSIESKSMPAGRFVPARTPPDVPDLPDWLDVSPRFGVSYDLFGNARTALRGSVNKYMRGMTTGIAARYNAMRLQIDTRTWQDRDLLRRDLPTNGDDIAQDNEIGATQNLAFGSGQTTGSRPDPDLRREFDLEYTAGVEHQIFSGTSVGFAWYRRGVHRLEASDNLLLSPSDYSPVNIFNPLDGEEIILYNVDRTKLGQLDIVDSNATDPNLRRQSYNGFELSVKARLPYGATMFGGWTIDRIVDVGCDRSDDPNTLRFCDQSILNIPFRSEFKIAGIVPAPGQFQINVAFQSYAGREIPTTWTLTRNTRYDNDCAGACQAGQLVVPTLTASTLSIRLTPPGTKFLERLNQLDVGVRKIFRVGKVRLSLQSDLFNAFNTSWIKSEVQVYGPTLGMPLDILQPRTLRLAMQYQF